MTVEPTLTPPVTPTPVVPRRRLHPLTPLLRGLRLAVIVVAAVSWNGFQDLGMQRWLLAVAAVGVLLLIISLVSYLATGYEVVGRELRITEGLLSRRNRAIPLERVQSIELVQPLLARPFGLAELRLEVVGGNSTEAPLAFLTLAEAKALRTTLLALSKPTPEADSGPADAPVPSLVETPPPTEHPLLTVPTGRLVASQLFRPQWWLLPVAVFIPLFDYQRGGDVGFVALASTVTAILGALLMPVRAMSGDWRFTLATAPDGLRIRRGLFETRSQTVPAGRIQAVMVESPLLWRIFGWVRATLHIAGVRVEQGQQARAGLLPVGTLADAELVLATAVPGFSLAQTTVRRPPTRAWIFAPLGRLVMGYQLAPTTFVTRDGLLRWRVVAVPYERIQSVRLRQGPLQRMLRLATVHVDVAGGGLPSVAAHQPVEEARWLALELADRARAFR